MDPPFSLSFTPFLISILFCLPAHSRIITPDLTPGKLPSLSLTWPHWKLASQEGSRVEYHPACPPSTHARESLSLVPTHDRLMTIPHPRLVATACPPSWPHGSWQPPSPSSDTSPSHHIIITSPSRSYMRTFLLIHTRDCLVGTAADPGTGIARGATTETLARVCS